MFGRSRRALRAEIRHLEERLAISKSETRSARLECGQQRREKAVLARTAEHIGDDRIASEKLLFAAQMTIAARDNQLDDWSSIAIVQAERHGRLIRAIVRYRAELGALAEELAAQDARDWDLTARPAKARVRTSRRLEVAS
jgi:hypothetical protein